MKDYSFGNYICVLRTGLGLSQFQLGNLVGVSDKAVSKWENGDSKPRINTCRRLADVFGVSLNELLSCDQPAQQARKEQTMTNIWLWKQAYDRLYSIYGKNPPVRCLNRLMAEEIDLKNSKAMPNYAILATIQAQARKHNTWVVVEWPFTSYFTAWLLGATELNPLPPHYYCPQCCKTEFVDSVRTGFDLPEKNCSCGAQFKRDGHNIPFNGYTSHLQNGIQVTIRASAKFIPHAVEIMKDLYSEFASVIPVAPYEHEDANLIKYVIATDPNRTPHYTGERWEPTIYEFHEWYDVDPEPMFEFVISSELDELESFDTDIKVPSLEDLLDPTLYEQIYSDCLDPSPTLRKLLNENGTPPFEMLMKIFAFGRDTCAWEENGEILVREGQAQLHEIPCVRDDIWNDIMSRMNACGIYEPGFAYKVMEASRKGKYFRGMPDQIATTLRELGMPAWYCRYLENLHYLDSKGRCLSALLHILKLAWYEKKLNKD